MQVMVPANARRTLVPTSALVSVDLPAFGAPTTPTCSSCCCSVGTTGTFGLYGSGTYSVYCSSSSMSSQTAKRLNSLFGRRCGAVDLTKVAERSAPMHCLQASSLRFVNKHTRCLLDSSVLQAEQKVAGRRSSIRAFFRQMCCPGLSRCRANCSRRVLTAGSHCRQCDPRSYSAGKSPCDGHTGWRYEGSGSWIGLVILGHWAHCLEPWCSGYHVCLTRSRSPVRSWPASVNCRFAPPTIPPSEVNSLQHVACTTGIQRLR